MLRQWVEIRDSCDVCSTSAQGREDSLQRSGVHDRGLAALETCGSSFYDNLAGNTCGKNDLKCAELYCDKCTLRLIMKDGVRALKISLTKTCLRTEPNEFWPLAVTGGSAI